MGDAFFASAMSGRAANLVLGTGDNSIAGCALEPTTVAWWYLSRRLTEALICMLQVDDSGMFGTNHNGCWILTP